MKVSLVSISKSNVESLTSLEDLLVYTARVSNPKNQLNTNTGPKLLKYCLDNGHFSIFEMGNMCIEIITSRAIATQILRHRSFSFQEFSQRYAEIQDFELYEARSQDNKNRQNSIDNMSSEDKEWFKAVQEGINKNAMNYYKQALDRNIAKEQARMILPLSTQTKLYMNGTIRSWIHYIDLRTANGTQKEHKDIAEAIKTIFCEQFPAIAKAKGWV